MVIYSEVESGFLLHAERHVLLGRLMYVCLTHRFWLCLLVGG